MSSFQRALKRFTNKQRKQLDRRLAMIGSASQVGLQVVHNMQNEHRLPVSSAEAMLRSLLQAEATPEDLKQAYVAACRQNVLKGKRMKGIRPKLLGRALVASRFYRLLVELEEFSTEEKARHWLNDLRKLDDPAEIADAMSHLPLGRYLVWATFHNPERTDNPFDFLPADGKTLMDMMGLDANDFGKPVLLFVYQPPDDQVLRFPTVADAQWYVQFRPATDNASHEHGWTLPITDMAPQPEIVHLPWNFDSLQRNIKQC